MCKNSKRRVKSIYDLPAFFPLACRWGLTQFMHSSLSADVFPCFFLYFPSLLPLLLSYSFSLFSLTLSLFLLFSISFFSLPFFLSVSRLFHMFKAFPFTFPDPDPVLLILTRYLSELLDPYSDFTSFEQSQLKHLHKLFFFDVFLIKRTKTFNSLKLDN
jgi:hypothetical protein